jgi:hypothetical protein
VQIPDLQRELKQRKSQGGIVLHLVCMSVKPFTKQLLWPMRQKRVAHPVHIGGSLLSDDKVLVTPGLKQVA